MTLQTVVGLSLGALQGIASPEVGRAYGRGYDLWKQLGSRPELFAIVGGLWAYYVVAGGVDTSRGSGAGPLPMVGRGKRPPTVVAPSSPPCGNLHPLGGHPRAADK